MREDSMRFSVRTKVILFCLLVILGLVFRFPTTPHEIGWDSFAVHLMANSVSEFGYAKWWIHPTSVIGWYPYSSVSAVPFILSDISQCAGMDMEKVILLYSMFLGIFSIFGAYLMAGAIWNNDLFKFLVTFVFSTSQGIITFSTWTANARTLFVISLPLFIYLLLKTRAFKVRFSILTFVTLMLLLTTHHYIYFTIPIIIGYLIIVMVYKSGNYVKSIRIPENFANFAVFASFSIMFLIPYFYRSLWWTDPEMGRSAGGASIYTWISTMMLSGYIRYIGILIIFVVGGYMYLLFKQNKSFEEWFLLLVLANLAPLLYIPTYMKWFIICFACLLIGVALTNIAIAGMRKEPHIEKRKYAVSFVVILLLLSVSFTGYYQYLHFLNDPDPHTRYMEERTYVGALWMKDNINKDKNMIAEGYICNRIFSIAEVPTLTGVAPADLAYGFVNPNKLEIKQIHSPFSVAFYFHEPYKAINHSLTASVVDEILNNDINNLGNWGIRSIPEFNLSHYVENKDLSNTFTRSIEQIKNNLYDNGKIRVWSLN